MDELPFPPVPARVEEEIMLPEELQSPLNRWLTQIYCKTAVQINTCLDSLREPYSKDSRLVISAVKIIQGTMSSIREKVEVMKRVLIKYGTDGIFQLPQAHRDALAFLEIYWPLEVPAPPAPVIPDPPAVAVANPPAVAVPDPGAVAAARRAAAVAKALQAAAAAPRVAVAAPRVAGAAPPPTGAAPRSVAPPPAAVAPRAITTLPAAAVARRTITTPPAAAIAPRAITTPPAVAARAAPPPAVIAAIRRRHATRFGHRPRLCFLLITLAATAAILTWALFV